MNKEVFATVYDAPVLRYFADNNDSVCMVGDYIVKEQYGIVAKEGNPDLEKINRSILKFREDGRYQKIKDDWFKK
jgi:ABC-type amino acid transport substrate-binding protein